jgi:6-phospho-beta-glucosidase
LNHLGWLRRIVHQGVDRLPELLADDARLGQLDEAGMFGPDWLRMLGAVPNEYLYYYYYQREARQSIEAAAQTRGEYLRDQQSAFYRESAQQPQEARRLWQAALAQREATYLSESREAHEERHSVGGGYEQVALAVMTAIAGDASTRLILNVANGTTISGLDASAVVEVPCLVDASGAHPQPTPPVSAEHLGLMQQVKAVERLTIEAAATRSAATATRALALHPLVDSVAVARILTRRYGDAFDLFD